MRMDIAQAAKDRQIELVRYLLTHSAAEHLRMVIEGTDEEYNGTALYWMSVNGELDLVSKLLECQADVNTCNIYKHTPLHAATDMGFLSIAKLLLKHGARTDVLNENGQTPLHLAAYRGHYNIVECLLKAGADYTIQNSRCLTPLQESIAMNHRQVATLFCKDDCSAESIATPTRVILTRTRSLSPKTFNKKCKSWSLPTNDSHSYQSKHHKSQEFMLSPTEPLYVSTPVPMKYQRTHRTTTTPGSLKVCQPTETDDTSCLPSPAIHKLK